MTTASPDSANTPPLGSAGYGYVVPEYAKHDPTPIEVDRNADGVLVPTSEVRIAGVTAAMPAVHFSHASEEPGLAQRSLSASTTASPEEAPAVPVTRALVVSSRPSPMRADAHTSGSSRAKPVVEAEPAQSNSAGEAGRWARALAWAAGPLVRASVYVDARVGGGVAALAGRRQRLIADTESDRTAVAQSINAAGNGVARALAHTAQVLGQPSAAVRESWNAYRASNAGSEKAVAFDRLVRDLGAFTVAAVPHFYNYLGSYAGDVQSSLRPAGRAMRSMAGRARQDVSELSAPVRRGAGRVARTAQRVASRSVHYGRRSKGA